MHLTRRQFVKSAAMTAGAAYLMPAASWARVRGANDRIVMGVIGTGGMGTSHLHGFVKRKDEDNVVVKRVCDVYRKRLNEAVKVVAGSESAGTMEYREVLDDKDVNAILIATPDHWHTKIAIEAMEAGKDVYCEKPLSLTTEQALQCRDAVKRTGRALEVGPQYTSCDSFWKAREAIGEGRIGKVVWSQAAYCRNSRGGQFNWDIDPKAGPQNPPDSQDYVWWDRWLGSEWNLAPKIPWNPDHFFRFRKYFAYNGGVATDLLYHKLAPLLLAISGPNGEYPKRVVASGGKFLEKDERDIPDTFMMMVDYPSEHTIVLASVMTNDVGLDTVIRGQYGTINFTGGADTDAHGNLVFKEQGSWAPEFRKANADKVPPLPDNKKQKPSGQVEVSEGSASWSYDVRPRRDHVGNFLDSVRGKAKPDCNVDLGASTMVAIKMGVEAYRRNKVLLWDPKAEKIVES